jgi:phospholipid N-methyltransferase
MLSPAQQHAEPHRSARQAANASDGRRARSHLQDAAAPAPAPGRWRRAWVFALNFLRHPLAVGTAFQSSPALVRRLVRGSDWRDCRSVVELGPGVGTVTSALLQQLSPTARLLAVESNPGFVAELRRTLPDPRLLAVHGNATALRALLERHGIGRVDAAISGIPFSTMPRAARAQVLDAVADALADQGEFVVYQHTAMMVPLLRERFATVTTEIEWRNLVPMRIFRCRGPRPR